MSPQLLGQKFPFLSSASSFRQNNTIRLVHWKHSVLFLGNIFKDKTNLLLLKSFLA